MNKIFNTVKKQQYLIGIIVRNYAFKSDLKIKWVRPEKIPCYKPAKSGDLSSMPPINRNQYLLEFQNCKELETANEYVKRLFTLKFNSAKHVKKLYITNQINQIKSHELDGKTNDNSVEVILATWTAKIRAWQEIMETFPRNKRLKVALKEVIDKRKKHLKLLRRTDYKKFEWLLEELNIIYKPHPPEYKWVTRKDSLTKLTDKYCDNLKEERLNALKTQFENEQPSFLQDKINTLEFIRNEQKECEVEVTITQEEIDAVKKQLEELKLKRVVSEEY